MVRYGEGHVGDGALGDVDAVDQLLRVHVDWVEREALHDFFWTLVQSSLKNQLIFLSISPPERGVFILSFSCTNFVSSDRIHWCLTHVMSQKII